MTTDFPTAPSAYGLNGPSAAVTVEKSILASHTEILTPPQYFPKGIDLSAYSQSKLSAIARKLNERPRKTLNYETPAQRFYQTVASTG